MCRTSHLEPIEGPIVRVTFGPRANLMGVLEARTAGQTVAGPKNSMQDPRRSRFATTLLSSIRIGLRMMLFGLPWSVLPLEDAFAATLQVGSSRAFQTVRAAAQASNDGDTVEIDAGTYTNDVATWSANNLTVRGVGGRARLVITNGTNEGGKAIWVVGGINFTAENIEFSGATVPDQNGAGIRAEGAGTFTVRNCYFHDNENGILGGDGNSAVLIEYSTFDHNGFGDGFSHNMYIGPAQSFTLRYSYTHRAIIGHDVKTRAATNSILYNRIMDESDGSASYEVDVPDGGRTFLIGNVIEQGPNTDNSVIVAYAAESARNGVLELYAINNTIVNNRSAGGNFFSLRSGTTAVIRNNILYGPGTTWSGGTVTASNNYVQPTYNNSPGFVSPSTFDYHLSASSPQGASGVVDAGVAPGSSGGQDLTPLFQYVYDAQAVARSSVGGVDIGAFESSNSGAVVPLPPTNVRVQ